MMANKRAFTMIELLLAVSLVGVMTVFATLTFWTVVNSWQVSTDYVDKFQRTDFALNQVATALKNAYFPVNTEKTDLYGMEHENSEGEADTPDNSDKLRWVKNDRSLIGNRSIFADTEHKVELLVLEKGETDYFNKEIEKTGLYARFCPMNNYRHNDDRENREIEDITLSNLEEYEPHLISDGIVGMDFKFLEKEEKDAEWTDTWTKSNALPYKVMVIFKIEDFEKSGHASDAAPSLRVVELPMHLQSIEPVSIEKNSSKGGKTVGGGARRK